MILIDAAQVRQHLSFERCISLVREAMVSLSNGESPRLQRSGIPVAKDAIFGVMPGVLGGVNKVFGAKLLGIFPEPERPSHQRHQGLVVVFDGHTGAPLCVADAEEVTAIRTAAASALATETLARDDACTLAVFGNGTQARSHLRALTACRRYERILVWGRDVNKAREFAAEMCDELGLPIRAEPSAEAAARNSDVICTLTGAFEPIVLGAWIQPGTHLNVVGSSMAGPAEIDGDLVARSRFYVDSRASALTQAAEFLRARDAGLVSDAHILAELGEVLVNGSLGRAKKDDVTIYKSLGNIVQDLAVVRWLYTALQGQKSPPAS